MAKTKHTTKTDEDGNKKTSFKEFISTILWALGIALILRTFLFQPFHIPSGSMEPNLVQGDYLIATKYSVGYGKYAADPFPFPSGKTRFLEREPQRGDILIFKPDGNKKNYIKRLIGMPGDQVQMKKGVLFINNIAVEMAAQGQAIQVGTGTEAELWQEIFPEGHSHHIYDSQKNNEVDNTPIYTVPAGFYFMMGDNRDNSLDSRVRKTRGGVDYVPAQNIIGRAEFVLLSVTPEFSLIKPWTWGNVRGERFFKGLR